MADTSERLSRFQIAASTSKAAKEAYDSIPQQGEVFNRLLKHIQKDNAFGKVLKYGGYAIDTSKIALKVYSAQQEKGTVEAINVAVREAIVFAVKEGAKILEKKAGTQLGGFLGTTLIPVPVVGTVVGGVVGGLLLPKVLKLVNLDPENVGKLVGEFYDKQCADTVRKFAGEKLGLQQTTAQNPLTEAKPGNGSPGSGGTGNHSPGAASTTKPGQAKPAVPSNQKPASPGDKKPGKPGRPVTEGDDWYSQYLRDVTKDGKK